ncbi:MAG: DUF6084 family protein [Mycobacteriales bacterium]|jgi:hypothetical protein
MTELDFEVLDVHPEPYAAVPTLTIRLRIDESTGAQLWAVALRAQVRIEPQRRRYTDEEKDSLLALFGDSGRWAETLHPFQWTYCTAMVPGFSRDIELDLTLECTYDFDVAASKYMHALRDGEIPIVVLFSGTAFVKGGTGVSVEQIPWHKEAKYRLPVAVWRELMDLYFPNSGWLRMSQETIDALARFRSSRALPSWDQTFAALLAEAQETSR